MPRWTAWKSRSQKRRISTSRRSCSCHPTWVSDPAGLRWETFHTFGDATRYGEDPALAAALEGASCCGIGEAKEQPQPAPAACCGSPVAA